MVIGITGGIGCGKSTVLNILKEKYNAHIIDADKTAHRLMEYGTQVYDKIVTCFGREIIAEDLSIDRKRLGALVFNDSEKLACLNGIVHPAVKDDIIAEIKSMYQIQHYSGNRQYYDENIKNKNIYNKNINSAIYNGNNPSSEIIIAVEAALFIEAGYMDICDELWYIYTEKEIRIQRLTASRGYTREKAESIIANQLSDSEFRKHCHIVIDNGGSMENTEIQIAAALKKQSRK